MTDAPKMQVPASSLTLMCRLASSAALLRCIRTLALLGTFVLWVPLAQGQLPTTVGWTALPATTSLEGSGACPPNNFEGDPFQFAELCRNVIRTWNGAIADTTANRLIIWGGGHNNYYGNEIYTLNLTANPITLTRIKDPTIPTNYANSEDCIDGIPPGSPNFAPNSREDYGGLAFIPGPYQMYITGGALACLEADQSQNTWTISLNNLSNASTWVHENPTIVGPVPGSDGGFTYGMVADYDPNSGLVFLSDSAAIYSYNFQTNAYALVSRPEGFVTSIYLSGAIDPTRKIFVLVGGCGGGTCGPGDGVFVADISNPATTTQQNWTTATMADPVCAEYLSGGATPISASNPGITFDSVANDYVGWPNQGNNVYILTPDTVNKRLTCQRLTFPNGPPNSSHANNTPNTSYGTFGRFRYFPALDAFVLVNDWNIPPYVLLLRSPDSFTLSATPSSASVIPGGTATYTVNSTALNGFAGAVNLSVTGLPSGATAAFNPASITPGASSTLTITTNTSTPQGQSVLNITGTSGSLTQSATVTLNVATASFSLAAAPSVDSVNPGGSTTSTVTATALNGFTGTVNLSVTSGLPTGASASFNPTSIAPGGSSTLTITTTSGTPAANSTLTITGTSGVLSESTSLVLSVTSFTLSATPGTASTHPGGTATYSVSATALNGFTGPVNLSLSGLPTGATASFNPVSIAPGGSSTLTVTTTSSTPVNNSTLTVTGTCGPLSESTTVVLGVSDFTVSAAPSSASVNPGGSASYTVSTAALNGFTGTVNFSVSGLPTGATASFNPAAVAPGASSTLTVATSSSTPVGISTLTITGACGSLTHSASVMLNVSSSTSSATAISIDFVGLGATPMASSEVAGVVALSNWNDAAGASSSSPLALVDQNGNPTTATLTWTADDVWDQPIANTAGNLRMMKGYLDNGNLDTSTVTVSGLPGSANGYLVYIYAQGASNNSSNTGIYQISGAGISTTSATLTYNSNFNGTFTQATAGNPVGNYVVLTIPNVPGFTLSAIPSTASTIYKRAPVNGIQIVPMASPNPDFTISAAPATQSIVQGGSATYTVTTAALNGLAGTINLSLTSGLPTGATASFNPASVAPGASSTLTVATSSGTPVGSSTLIITGTCGSLTHSTSVMLNVSSSTSSATAISIDFVGLGATPMASSEVAGVVALSNWNDAAGASSSSPLALMDQNGNPTTATLTWTADDVWDQPIANTAGNLRMMKGYLDNGSQDTTTVTVGGLPSDPNGFTVYVYAQGGSGNATHTGIYQISGTGITTSSVSLTYNATFNGTFTQATVGNPVGNYVVLTIPNVPGFTLSAIPSTASNGNERAPVNGIQVVPN